MSNTSTNYCHARRVHNEIVRGGLHRSAAIRGRRRAARSSARRRPVTASNATTRSGASPDEHLAPSWRVQAGAQSRFLPHVRCGRECNANRNLGRQPPWRRWRVHETGRRVWRRVVINLPSTAFHYLWGRRVRSSTRPAVLHPPTRPARPPAEVVPVRREFPTSAQPDSLPSPRRTLSVSPSASTGPPASSPWARVQQFAHTAGTQPGLGRRQDVKPHHRPQHGHPPSSPSRPQRLLACL